jgi:hypothetical protein
MATTTNFGWETPDDTDLVKDGALAMRTLGNSIDTSFVDLKGGTTGQNLRKNSNTDLDFTWAGDATNTVVDAAGDLLYGTAADTLGRLAIGTTGQVLTVSAGVPAWSSPASGGGMTSLATGTLASAIEGASITSISGSYNHLQLFVYGYQFSQDGYLCFRFNSDSTSNIYQCSIQNFDNSGTSVDENFSGLTLVSGNGNYSANLNGTGYIACLDLFNYASTSMQKHFRLTVSDEANSGSPYVSRVITGRYKSTSAVTSVQIRTEGTPTTFAAGSYLLYGVK